MAEDIVKLLYRPGSTITSYLTQRRYPIPRGTPSTGPQNARGGNIFAIFDRNRRLSRKGYEIDPRALSNGDNFNDLDGT